MADFVSWSILWAFYRKHSAKTYEYLMYTRCISMNTPSGEHRTKQWRYGSSGPSIVPVARYTWCLSNRLVQQMRLTSAAVCGVGPVAGTFSAGIVTWSTHIGAICSGNRHYCAPLVLLRGTIVNRTYGIHKTYILSPFLLTIFGPINYDPP